MSYDSLVAAGEGGMSSGLGGSHLRQGQGYGDRGQLAFLLSWQRKNTHASTWRFFSGGFSARGGEDYGDRPPRAEIPLPTVAPFTAFVGNLSFDATNSDIEGFFHPLTVSCSLYLLLLVSPRAHLHSVHFDLLLTRLCPGQFRTDHLHSPRQWSRWSSQGLWIFRI